MSVCLSVYLNAVPENAWIEDAKKGGKGQN